MEERKLNRRDFLHLSAGAAVGTLLAACQPKVITETVKETVEVPVPVEVEKVVEETVVVVQTPEPVTIRFNGRTGNEEDIYRERAEAFQAEHPTINVQLEMFPAQEYMQKLEVMFAGGTAGDVIYDILVAGFYHRHAWRGEYQPLDDIIAAQGLDLGQYFPTVVDAATFEGQMYGLPRNCHPGQCGLFYNKTLFEEAGIDLPSGFDSSGADYGNWDLDEFLEIAKALTRDTDGDGKVDQFGFFTSTDMFQLNVWIRGFGGWDYAKDGKTFLFDSPEAMEAIQYVYDLIYEHHVFPTPSEITDMMFDTGRVAMWLTGVWGKRARGRVGDRFEIGGVPMAKGPAGHLGLGSMFEFDPLCIYKNCEHPEAAFEWLKWMTNQESGIRLAEHGMAPGARPDVWSSPRLVGDPLFDMFAVVMDEVLPYRGPWNFRALEIYGAFQGTMDLMWLGKGTPEEIVPQAVQAVQDVLETPREEA